MDKKIVLRRKNQGAKLNILETNFLQEKIVQNFFWGGNIIWDKNNIIHKQMAKQLTFEVSIKW